MRTVRPGVDPAAKHHPAPPRGLVRSGGSGYPRPRGDDGELYGHHQPFRDLFLQRLVDPAVDRGFDVVPLGTALAEEDPETLPRTGIADRTSWSCHHGVLRWSAECPCTADGRWKQPLRVALDRLAGAIDAVTEIRARQLAPDLEVWAARDAYVDVVIGLVTPQAFSARLLGDEARVADRREIEALMDAQRWRLAMFASDGWYWEDPSRPETKQALRAAARAARLVDGLAGTRLERRLVEDLALLVSPHVDRRGGDLPGGARRGGPAARDDAGPGNGEPPARPAVRRSARSAGGRRGRGA